VPLRVSGGFGWRRGIVPVAVEVVAGQWQRVDVGVRVLDADGVLGGVQDALDGQVSQ